MGRHADVVIVGGGIVGCLTAYYLGLHGCSTVIVERDGIGSQASGNAAGLLTHYVGAVGHAMLAFAEECQRLHRELAERLPQATGVNYHYGLTPMLRVAFTDEDEEELRRWYWERRQEGAVVTWLSSEEAVRYSGGWLTPEVRAAVVSELEPQVDAYRLMLAVAQAAEAQGCHIRGGEVVGLVARGDRCHGVALADGSTVQGGAVLLAMGPWSTVVREWAGLSVPVEPLRGQILGLSLPGARPELAIFHVLAESYVFPKLSGDLLIGTTWERAGYDRRVTPEGRDGIIRGALRLCPSLQAASVVEARACLRPLSLDDYPIIGPVPGWEGLYIATGHGPEGLLLSAATGEYLGQLIATGRSDYDLSPFSPGRFAKEDAGQRSDGPRRPHGT